MFFERNISVIGPNSSYTTYQKIKFCGTKGNYESDQKNRGIKIVSDNDNFQEPNPDFCQSFISDDNLTSWKGYGIKSVLNFLEGVRKLNSKKNISAKVFDNNSASFKDALISTAVIEAASKLISRS